MIRRFVSITLLVSIVALGCSGLSMIILDSFKFQLQMHPVHKIFGVIMCVAGSVHVFLNFKPIKKYLQSKSVLLAGVLLTVLMIFLVVVGLNKPLDSEFLNTVEEAMSQAE